VGEHDVIDITYAEATMCALAEHAMDGVGAVQQDSPSVTGFHECAGSEMVGCEGVADAEDEDPHGQGAPPGARRWVGFAGESATSASLAVRGGGPSLALYAFARSNAGCSARRRGCSPM
jgi:hypothetical protein